MRLSPFLIFSQAVIFSVFGLPDGVQVVSGNASVTHNEQSCVIQSGKDSILHWDRFSIEKHESVQFVQPSRDSSVLNRVIGGMESQLLGSLESNGKVYLINPSGIFFGPDAKIESAGFIASVSDVLDESFLNGKDLQFSGDGSGSLINLGTIHCPTGDIVLIGKMVRNEGSLSAPEGLTALVSGSEVLLKCEGSERVFIAPDLSDGGVDHSGSISALSAELKSGVSPFSKAVRVSGEINASSIRTEQGRVYLVAGNGKAEVSGQIAAPGGEIRILGKEVHLLDESKIDVSSQEGGGRIFVGGSFQGKDRSFEHAAKTFVYPDSIIRADALERGDGGTIIAWGDEVNVFHGRVSAQGGPLGGDGGFVEVSSPGFFEFLGDVKTLAPSGKLGTLLLDPPDITISNAVNSNVTFSSLTYTTTAAGNGNVQIGPGAGTLLTNLASNNVTIDTTSGSGGNGDITLVNGLTWTVTPGGGSTLTLNAVRDVVMNNFITNSTTNGSIVFTAGRDALINDTVTYSPGATGVFNVTAANDITFSGGSITHDGTGNMTLIATNGNAALGGYASSQNTTYSVTAGGAISTVGMNSTFTGSNFVAISLTAHGNITTGTPVVGVSINGSINTVDGDIVVDGTSLGNSNAGNIGVDVGGVFLSATGLGKISITGHGGPGTDDNYGIQIDDSTIVQLNVVNGDLFLDGTGGQGSGVNNIGIISPSSSVTAFNSSGSGKITMIGTGGSGSDSAVGISLLTGPVTSSGTGDISLTGQGGSSSMNNNGLILASAINASNNAKITIDGTGGTAGTGNIGVRCSTNITAFDGTISLNGAAGAGTTTGFVTNFNTVSTTGAGSIQLNTSVGDFLMQDSALISAGTTGTVTGNIAGDLSLTANFKFSPVLESFAGAIDITAGGSILLTADASGHDATIRSNGPSPLMRLIAGRDIILTANGAGRAFILPASDTVLVVDNLFPTAPGHGTGSFQMDPGASAGSIIKLASGQLRIYTSEQSLNFINPLDTVNTLAYPIGTVGIDDAYHQWSIYYPGGTYGGPEFTFYFKEPFITPPGPTPPGPVAQFTNLIIRAVNQAVIANSQLDELLPFYYPYHKADIIDQEGNHSRYFFPRYEAFIFSNEVY